jgi:universal stress protein A
VIVRIKRILLPTDLSEASMPALELAENLGRMFNAELALLFVVEPLDMSGDILSGGALASAIEAQEKTARAHLARAATRLRRRGLRVRILVGTGKAAPVIVDTARQGSTDLIVIGTHGRSGLSHVFMGSVAERVVRTAGCPVLTVPRHAKQARRAASKRRRLRGSANGPLRVSTATLI